MVKKLLRPVLPVVIAVALTGTGFFTLGVWRRAADAAWCKKHATAGDAVGIDVIKEQRADCATQRQRQRTMFGAVWRRGGEATAECGFELARLQLLGEEDPKAASTILGRYGIESANFDASDRSNQQHFIAACLQRGGTR